MMLRHLTALALAVLLLAGCSGNGNGNGSEDVAEPPAGDWIATGLPDPFGPADRLSLTLGEDGHLTAQGTCATFTGEAEWGETLTVGSLGATEIGCPPIGMRQDIWVRTFLTGSPEWEYADDVLTLTRGAQVLEFRPRSEVVPDATLDGPAWVLTSVIRGTGDGATTGTVESGVRATLVLRDGEARVGDGCNQGSGPVAVAGDIFDLREVTMTQRGCTGAAASVARIVDDVLFQGPVTWTVSGNELTLVGSDPDVRLVWTAAL